MGREERERVRAGPSWSDGWGPAPPDEGREVERELTSLLLGRAGGMELREDCATINPSPKSAPAIAKR